MMRQKDIPDISIADESLVLTQSDMDNSNFGVDSAGRPVILDFGEIGWLPESLALFTLFKTTGFANAVAGQLFDPEEAVGLKAQRNLYPMAFVKALLGVAAQTSLCMYIHFQRDTITPSRRLGRRRQRVDQKSTSPSLKLEPSTVYIASNPILRW